MPTSTQSAAPAAHSEIDQEIEKLQQQIADKRAEKERQAEQKEAARYLVLDRAKVELGVTSDEEIITMLRNRNISSQKAKRIPESTLRQMKQMLIDGATAPAVAKAFKVTLSTVHSRKASWGLTHRVPVKRAPVAAAPAGRRR